MAQSASSERLKALRSLMAEKNIDFYYTPTRDDHNNEYVPPHWKRREWLTGFTGSYGQALIGKKEAYLWTDPRYFLQAENQLDAKSFKLMKQLQGVAAPISSWLGEHALNATVAVDPKVMSMSDRKQWVAHLSRVNGELIALPANLIDQIWKDRIPLELKRIHILDEKYTGLSAKNKIDNVRTVMQAVGADAMVISMLDEIAWLFNIRGNDIPYNPLAISYAIVTKNEAVFFAHLDQIEQDDFSYFVDQGVTLKTYDEFSQALQALIGNVLVDPKTTSWWVESQLTNASLIRADSPICMMKAIKNKTELAGMAEAHRLDALAVVKFLHWIENHWQAGIDEITASDKLESFRREESRCVDLSFPTICGFGDHGAIVHYFATEGSQHKIDDTNMLLVDSGGQYFEGTTDITRTFHLGEPTSAQKKHYTMVLKGHLALRHMKFPDGVCGENLNPIARLPLWAEGMDYGHGTGHGVGCYLCVHEGPQRIAYGYTGVPLQPGMIVSNEPGLYFDGQYGIRIENLCAIVEKISSKNSPTGNGPFYGLEDLTIVPHARKLIDVSLLTAQEIEWVNAYHQKVYDVLSKYLSGDVLDWLKEATQPL